MTKQESDDLIAEARQYFGQPYVAQDGHGNDLETSEFLGSQETETDEDYQPLAVFRNSIGRVWTRRLDDTLALYRIWNKRK